MPSDNRVIEHKNSLETSVLNVTNNQDTEILKKNSRYKQSQSRKSSPNI